MVINRTEETHRIQIEDKKWTKSKALSIYYKKLHKIKNAIKKYYKEQQQQEGF